MPLSRAAIPGDVGDVVAMARRAAAMQVPLPWSSSPAAPGSSRTVVRGIYRCKRGPHRRLRWYGATAPARSSIPDDRSVADFCAPSRARFHPRDCRTLTSRFAIDKGTNDIRRSGDRLRRQASAGSCLARLSPLTSAPASSSTVITLGRPDAAAPSNGVKFPSAIVPAFTFWNNRSPDTALTLAPFPEEQFDRSHIPVEGRAD